MSTQYRGTLKFFRSDRPGGGFGFLRRDDSNIEDFLHASALRDAGINPDSLEDGFTRFSYELTEDPKTKRPKAANVRILD